MITENQTTKKLPFNSKKYSGNIANDEELLLFYIKKR